MMKLPQFLATITLTTLLSTTVIASTFAKTIQEIPVSVAQGLSEIEPIITIWPGRGINLDFTQTGEMIQKVWLDDPSKVTLDFDGSLENGAQIIHLKRLTGIHFPNLPSTSSTLLSVVTQSSAGQHLYTFSVKYGTGQPQYHTLRVIPELDSSDDEIVTSSGQTANLLDVELGLKRVIRDELIPADSPLIRRVQEFLVRVRQGASFQGAASGAGVSLSLISKLAELGMPNFFPLPSSNESTIQTVEIPVIPSNGELAQ